MRSFDFGKLIGLQLPLCSSNGLNHASCSSNEANICRNGLGSISSTGGAGLRVCVFLCSQTPYILLKRNEHMRDTERTQKCKSNEQNMCMVKIGLGISHLRHLL